MPGAPHRHTWAATRPRGSAEGEPAQLPPVVSSPTGRKPQDGLPALAARAHPPPSRRLPLARAARQEREIVGREFRATAADERKDVGEALSVAADNRRPAVSQARVIGSPADDRAPVPHPLEPIDRRACPRPRRLRDFGCPLAAADGDRRARAGR
jgi:hypothetical protein